MSSTDSTRHNIAKKIAQFIRDNELANIHGGDVTLRKEKRTYYYTSFSRPLYLDGGVAVYSEKFVRITWSTSYRSMPSHASVILTADKAIDFIRLAFVEFEFEAAKEMMNDHR